MRIGLLLEGGTMHGLYTAGVLDFLIDNNIVIDDIIGVSAGALFGMNYKSKQAGRVLRYNKKYVSNKDFMGLHSLITTGNIMNKDFCFNKLVNELDPIDFKTYKNSKENFYAVVTNIDTGKAEYIKIDYLRNQEQMEYLRASGLMPFVPKPVCIQGKKYLDCGITDSIPIDKMMTMGYDKVVVVLTRLVDYRKKKSNSFIPKLYYHQYPNLVNAINNRYIVYNRQLDTIERLGEEQKIFVIRPTKQVYIKRMEKNPKKIQEMYDLGVHYINQLFSQLLKYLNVEV